MKKFYSIFLMLVFATSSVFAAEKIVFFEKNTSAADREAGALLLGGQVKRDMPEISAAVVIFPDVAAKSLTRSVMRTKVKSITYEEDNLTVNWLKQSGEFNPNIKRMGKSNESKIRPITKITLSEPQDEMAIAAKEVQQKPWGIGRVEANAAWQRGLTGAGVTVAVVDTGIKLNHPDLKANIIRNYSAITPGATGNDGNGHGTHVAGTIAAIDNKIGVVGVAPEAYLMAVQVLGPTGSGSFEAVADGIIWAANNGADVINMSLGSSYAPKAVEEAIDYAVSKGVAVICAAGNDGRLGVSYPAAFKNAIAVSASDIDSKIARFSNYGKEIAFIAPGVDILSTYIGPDYKSLNGTSMATPHVAGLAALAVQAGAKGHDGVLAELKKSARPLKDLTDLQQGNGFIKGRFIGK